MATFSQDNRIARLITPLGKDVLLLTDFTAHEGLSHLFHIDVRTISEKPDINFDQLIGQNCCIELDTRDGDARYFNGVLTHARYNGTDASFTHYDLTLRPWLWLLSRRMDCRFFLDKSVVDIAREVFKDAGFTDFDFRTNEDYEPKPYCVQYRESDLNFVSRLFEEHGIYYFFEHSEGQHTLVLADGPSSHKQNVDLPTLPFRVGWKGHPEQYLNDWSSARSFTSGKVELNDYDYLKPPKRMIATNSDSEAYKYSDFELYDHPGGYVEPGEGEKLAKIRLEAEKALDRIRSGSGPAPSLFPGSLTTVPNHALSSENGEYLVLRAYHRFTGEEYRTGSGGGSLAQNYRGNYEFLPKSRPYRALAVTPKPRVHGIHTAKVVGKKGEEGEEISTDKHGRVWVQFPWDRDKQTSCPIRVMQAWAGKRWGEIFIPRIGMEVVVEYVDGDPDRPLIVGCVYNGDNEVPYSLPDNKTKAGWKSDSSKGHNGYNEIVLEDKKGSEKIGVHAQKDLDVVVLNNETRSVTWNLDTKIGHAETREIGKSFKIPVGSASRETTIKMGDDKLTVEKGNIIYEAKLKIELIVGPSKITIEPWGVTIDAPTITLQGTGPVMINGLPVKIN